MDLSIDRIETLLLIAAVVAMAARRLHLSYTVGLTLTGVAQAFFHAPFELPLTKEIISTAFLPPLSFEAAFHMHWRELRDDAPVVVTLAALGVVLACVVTAAGPRYLAGWGWMAAILLGLLISATNPVSVIATCKEAGVTGRRRLLVESESLANDGTVAVLYVVALAAATGGNVNVGGAVGSFVVTVVGGVICGALVCGAVLLLARPTENRLVEITFSSVAT